MAALPAPVFRSVVDAVRFESDTTRRWIHRLCRVSTCDLQVGLGERLVVAGGCLCRDFLVDMLVEADRFLAAQPTARLCNPPGAVRIHVRMKAGDWTRRRRVEAGAQARTDRLRTSVIAAALPDDYHRALLEHIADEAGSLAPLSDEQALRRRLAELVADEFGGSVTDHLPRIGPGLAVVEATCRSARKVAAHPQEAGLVTWWERYVQAPLGRRMRFDNVPLDAPGHREAAAGPDRTDMLGQEAVETVLRVVAATAAGACLLSALHHAAAELVRQDLLTAAAAHSFVTDARRMDMAAEQVRVLMAA